MLKIRGHCRHLVVMIKVVMRMYYVNEGFHNYRSANVFMFVLVFEIQNLLSFCIELMYHMLVSTIFWGNQCPFGPNQGL